ncbi:HoxN/HupN/NixA family nickel/cobalt transporter [Cellulomonas wangsupingiae]|uniref:Nickel/cobalt efflux system n=1 Tax=Cellulomonas wangsupingiae TaxID=2968085 RepID=A0ABY5K3K3_9CELL|nr:HoxN/HupN/NixA family nickel/cobalt transporter [Cellulomonas wangsupingiae]MCC2336077.1 HoxN/HupN/NixA family nickel/cobalt transporter [Cellulomonas wangsupingiae]MCM0639613.1 HoxN/HupN/NixA family nickel/cobalt transporter [Cellulomonas wangsupingiae]UUI64799.1 HoxN/HupN/NixA family nickel/cobalt transporter [Cellulomonas wangsupingiae]
MSISVMASVVLALTVVGWGVLVLVVAPAHFQVDSTTVFGVGLGLTAYTLGMRHAFDADHIAAIDNTTRKLMADGQRPVSVGFWFSLGHSTIVFLLCALLAFGVRALAGQVSDETSTLQQTTGLIGISVSAVFLLLIGVINLVVLRQILRVFRDMRTGAYDEAALEQHLANRGLMNRILSGATKSVRKPWHMYPVGLLFGLGFDTATEVSLLVLAGGAAAFELPWYAILTLPVLFAAGMTLLDSIDGCFMNFAYGWAFSTPVRKVYYNITVTGLSVAVALLIGGIEVMSVLSEKLGLESGPVAWIGGLDLGYVGFVVVGLFVATWAVSLAVWRFGHVEERWTADLRPAPSTPDQP